MQRLTYSIEEIVPELGAELVQGDRSARVKTFDVDSRRIGSESLFIAMQGERVDGHEFLADAVERGAAGAIVERADLEALSRIPSFPVLKVESSQKSLEKLGRLWRDRSGAVVIGITGSVGKTTSKSILSHVLGDKFILLSTPANWNTEIGVPLTLGKLETETEIAVIEMAMRGRGQIALLSDIACPDQAIITNVRGVHLELLGSRDEIVQAKLEITSGLSKKGTLWLNHDEPAFSMLYSQPHAMDDFANRIGYEGEIKTFSIEGNADIVAHDIQLAGLLGSTFELVLPDSRARVDFPLFGKGAVACAAAIAGAAWKSGMDAEEIAHRLSTLAPERGRLERIDTDIAVVVNDCYNASPDSILNALGMLRSVQVFDKMPVALVLGDMLELGDATAEEHERVGRSVAALEPAFTIFAGKYCDHYVSGLSQGNEFPCLAVRSENGCYGDEFIDSVIRETRNLLTRTTERAVLLVKGSRSVGLDRLVDALTGNPEHAKGADDA